MPQTKDLQLKLQKAANCFELWSSSSMSYRRNTLRSLSSRLNKEKIYLASTISEETGKPITQSIAEVDKSIKCIDHYVSNIESINKSVDIPTESSYSGYKKKPLGIILGIMPWNYPLWQVIRFFIPTISVGNVVLMKHSSKVPRSAKHIESIIMRSDLPDHIYQDLAIRSSEIGFLIGDPKVKGVSLTGGIEAGRSVASICGKYLKRSVLELGGNDPFIVFDDADINLTVQGAIDGRFLNNGQSCISAKRFIIQDEIHDEFINLLQREIEDLKVGDPLDKKTDIGPLISEDAAVQIHELVEASISMGAKLHTGGNFPIEGDRRYLAPTLLSDVTVDMPIFSEEVFGPVASVTKFKDEREAVELANFSRYGLGCSIWTEDLNKAVRVGDMIESGNIFVNGIVRSDPRLPFGGVKDSGYGKELGIAGTEEFIDQQTWVVK